MQVQYNAHFWCRPIHRHTKLSAEKNLNTCLKCADNDNIFINRNSFLINPTTATNRTHSDKNGKEFFMVDNSIFVSNDVFVFHFDWMRPPRYSQLLLPIYFNNYVERFLPLLTIIPMGRWPELSFSVLECNDNIIYIQGLNQWNHSMYTQYAKTIGYGAILIAVIYPTLYRLPKILVCMLTK